MLVTADVFLQEPLKSTSTTEPYSINVFCFLNFFPVCQWTVLYRDSARQGRLVVLGFDATLTAKVISWRSAHVFLGFLTPVLTQLFFPKPQITFLTCFSRGERRNYAGKNVRLNRVSNSQPPGHESDTLITEPPGRDCYTRYIPIKRRYCLVSCSLQKHYNSLPNDKILNLSELKAFADAK